MASFTLSDQQAILDKCSPDSEAEPLTAGNLDTDLGELGYDPLVIAELSVRLNDDYGLNIPDEAFDSLKTPAALVAYISDRILAIQ